MTSVRRVYEKLSASFSSS